jgi:hypothetical protein
MNAEKKPEDSTTRRHYETQVKTGSSGGASAPHSTSRPTSTGSSGGASAPHSTSRPTSTNRTAEKSGGGFMGWLKRLFK